MHKSSRQFHRLASSAVPDDVPTDDAGSGLLEACSTRFASPDFVVECDVRHTVWVKRTDGSRSVGLPPWMLRQYSESQLMERVESKLGVPAAKL